MSTDFETRLERELVLVVAARARSAAPGPASAHPRSAASARRRRRTRVTLAVSAAGAACAVAAGVVVGVAGPELASGGGTRAYAVSSSADGTVTVKINAISDLTGLVKKLNALGLRTVMKLVPAGPHCRMQVQGPAPHNGESDVHFTVSAARASQTITLTFARKPPPGATIVLQLVRSGGTVMLVPVETFQGAPSRWKPCSQAQTVNP